MPVVNIDSAAFHVVVDGDAARPALILGHSLGATHRMWDAQLASALRTHRVVRFDLRGHGQTDVTPGPYSIERLARDVLAIADALDIERFAYCGLSLGGIVGQWLGAHAPQRLTQLVLASTAAFFGPPAPMNARMDQVRAGGMASITEATLARWFTPPFHAAQPQAVQAIRAQLLACPVEGYLAAIAAVRDADLRGALASIRTPTLVIYGADDPSTGLAQARELVDGIAGARLLELPGAHLCNVESAAAFDAALARHLSS